MMNNPGQSINVSDITIAWQKELGTCTFERLPVAMMWVDTTLAGLMSGVQTMVGTERFILALQSEGRKSVEADWHVISQFPDFTTGFKAIAAIAAVAGWGIWEIASLDNENKICTIRVFNSWESRYQKSLGVSWGSGMLAGKMAGYCSRLFNTNCWATQTEFAAKGAASDTFIVQPSPKTIEHEIDTLLLSDSATKADMAVALKKLTIEIEARTRAEKLLLQNQQELEHRVLSRTAELRESELKFTGIIESSPMGVHMYELSPHNELVFCGCNPAADKILGVENRLFIGKSILEAFPSLAASGVPEKYRQVCETGISWQTEQIVYRDEKISGAFEVYAFQTSPGKMAAFFLDITKKRQDEENLKQLEKQIQLMRNIESLGVLAGGIAHDFNNILTGVVGNLSLIEEMIDMNSELGTLVTETQRASQRASDLTQQLLTFSKGGDPVKKTSSMAEVIRDSVNFVLRGSKVAGAFDISPDLYLVDIDKGQMSQVIQNIIVNAKQAMPLGGTIRIRCDNIDNTELEPFPLPVQNRYIKIAITDTGIGIPPEIIDKIFEPYFSTKQEGSGLGLAITYSIVAKHGGYIRAESKQGHGTTFTIYLPSSQKEQTPEAPPSAAKPGRKLKVLVMDDDEIVCRVTTVILQSHGHSVEIAHSGESAIEKYAAAQEPFDCVVMDLTIPGGMGGVEAVQKILAIDPDAKVIVSSGFSNDPALAFPRKYGFCGVIAKPFGTQEFMKVLSDIFD